MPMATLIFEMNNPDVDIAREKWTMFRKVFICISSLLLILALTACSQTSSRQSSRKANATSWDQASGYIDEQATITGPVVSAIYASTSNGEPTFLNVGKDYPDPARFTVVIWGKNRDNFGSAPEDEYDGKTISVTGQVVEYNGIPEIVVTTPDQIKVK